MTNKTTFKPEYVATAKKLAEQGAVDREIAAVLEVSERTFHRWKLEQPELASELRLGKAAADERVEQSLYHRAIGYSYPSVKIGFYDGKPVVAEYVEHVPPDVTAGIFWLKNRKPDEWRDKQQIDVNTSPSELSPEEVAVRAASLFAKLAERLPENSTEEVT